MALTAFLPTGTPQILPFIGTPGAATVGHALVWSQTPQGFTLSPIAVGPDQFSGVLPVAKGGWGTNTGSFTSPGAITLAAGGNNSITLTPGAGGSVNVAGIAIRAGAGFGSQNIGSTANSSGVGWIAQGYQAGMNNISGDYWTAQGERAGQLSTTGTEWQAQGAYSGQNNSTGNYWAAHGTAAGRFNETGSNWIAQGTSAGRLNTTGSNFVAQGFIAAYSNATGSNWVAQGAYAGWGNVTGSNWIAQGFEAGYLEERGSTWHVGVSRSKSLVVGRFDTNCIYFGHAGPITSAATCPNPTAAVHCAASTTARASLRIDSGTAPTSPNDGDIWFDGTDLKVRVGGVTKTFSLI